MHRNAWWTAALGLALVVVAAVGLDAPADASTIFFIHDNNIWAAGPDGSDQRAVTTDGTATAPYEHVATAKVGAAPPLAFLRYDGSRFVYGTMRADGSGAAANPANDTLPMPGFTQGDNHEVSISADGTRIGWTRATNIGNGEVFSAYSIGTGGETPLEVDRSTGAIRTVFGDPSGQTLLFDDRVGYDYSDGNTAGSLWPTAPSACTAGVAVSGLVRQAPQPRDSGVAGPAPLAYYCEPSFSLSGPALSADGQTIAAVASGTNAGAGRIVTIPIGGVASGAAGSPLTYLTPEGSQGADPDFAPDGTAIVFADAGSGAVATVPVGGGAVTPIAAGASSPAWSPYTAPGGGSGGPTGGPGAGGGAGAGARGLLRSARLVHRTVHARQGIALRVSLTRPATVRVTLGRRAVARRHGHRRTVYLGAGSVRFRVKAGAHRLVVRHVHGRALRPGTYRLRVMATDGTTTAPARTLTVRVKR